MNAVETHKALDLSVYTPENVRTRLARDVAALSIEGDPKIRTVVPFTYLVNLETGLVTCPEYDPKADIRSFRGISQEIFQLCDFFLDSTNYPEEEDTFVGYLWVSGPDKRHHDSRVGAGIGIVIAPNLVLVQNYSGLNTDLSAEDCLNLGYWASTFSCDKSFVRAKSIQELRDNPIMFNCPEWSDPWEWILVTILKDELLYAYITSGEADRVYQERLAAAKSWSETAASGLATARTELDYIYLGAIIEIGMMRQLDIVLDGQESGCGDLNIDLLTNINNMSLTLFPTFEKSTTTLDCPQIKCSACGWTPNDVELAGVQSGHITCCPNPECGWVPGTDPAFVRKTPSIVESAVTTTDILANGFYETTSTDSNYYSSIEPSEQDVPWSISFFTPWLDPNLRSRYVVEESLVA
jgi:hypothetical protein